MANMTCNGIRYIIRQGDSLYKISRIYRVPLALILRANPYVDVYNLQVGDEICIPLVPQYIKPPAQGEENPFEHMMIYVIQAGDTLESILNRFGLSLEDLLKYNKMNKMMLQPGSTLEVPQRIMNMQPEMQPGMQPGRQTMGQEETEEAKEVIGIIEPEEEY